MKVSKHPLVRDGANLCTSRFSRLLGATAVAALVLAIAPVATAQIGADCFINGTLIHECGTTDFWIGSLPVAVFPYSASWSLVNNNAGAFIIGAAGCPIVQPGSDNCPVMVNVGQVGTFIIQLDLITQSGAHKTCQRNVVVVDTTPPVITCPPDATVECGDSTLPAATGTPTAVDCSPVTYSYTDAAGPSNCAGTGIIRTWTATDASLNVSTTCTQTITFQDTTAPTLTCPPDVTLPCGSNTTPYNPQVGYATVQDTCCPNIDAYATDVVTGSCPNGMTITRTWHGADCCGNQATCVQIITVGTGPCPIAAVTDRGGACENGGPRLFSSLPISPNLLHVRIASSAPNSALLFSAQLPPFNQPESYTAGCGTAFIDYGSPNTVVIPQTTDGTGYWAQTFGFDLSQVPGLLGVPILLQAGVLSAGPTPTLQLTNGLQLVGGTCPLYCTNTQQQYAGNGPAGSLVNANWQNLFPAGMVIGDYNLVNGAVAPNGALWTPDAAGVTNLQAFLAASGGTPASLQVDDLNPVTSAAGSLARLTAVLQLNVALSAAGLLGNAPLGSLVYLNPGDSLSGHTVAQILAASQQALAGLGLPAGYSYIQLAILLEDLSLSFSGCGESPWGTDHLFQG